MAEFTARRQAEAKGAGEWDSTAVNAADVEIGAALTLTSRSTHLLVERATALRDLPATAAALAAGRIDMPKALVFITGLNGQDPALAHTIEAQLIDRAPAQTTGQLRSALNRALLAADPEAAERRRQIEEKQARIERAPECGGTTATLAGRYLPVPATVAAWSNITTTARQLRQSGASGTLDELRVHVYLALLSGQAASGLAAEDSGPAAEDSVATSEESILGEDSGLTGDGGAEESDEGTSRNHAGDDTRTEPPPMAVPGTGRTESLTGSVNLTVPLVTLLGLAESPGDLGGFGPITAFTARDLAGRALDGSDCPLVCHHHRRNRPARRPWMYYPKTPITTGPGLGLHRRCQRPRRERLRPYAGEQSLPAAAVAPAPPADPQPALHRARLPERRRPVRL